MKTIFKALPIVANAYAEKFGVKVKIGGQEAYTDGQTIQLPALPEDYPNLDALWGYLAHEAAHVRLTQFADYCGFSSPLHQSLSNIFEDGRIEKQMMRLYPGTITTLNATVEYCKANGLFEMPDAKAHVAQLLTGYCLFWVRCHGLTQAVNEHLIAYRQCLISQLPMLNQVDLLLQQSKSLTSTKEAVALAQAVIDLLQSESQSDEQSDESSENANDESQEQPSAGDDSKELDSDSLDSFNSENSPEKAPSSSIPSTQQVLDSLLNATDDEVMGDLQSHILQSFRDDEVENEIQPLPTHTMHDSGSGCDLLHDAAQASMMLRAQLMGLVQANQRVSVRYSDQGRRLARTQLHRVATGCNKVFVKSVDKVMPNTAVHFLIDCSASMAVRTPQNQAMGDVALQAALCLALGLETIKGVHVSASCFTGSKHYTVLNQSERVAQQAGRFKCGFKGNTPLAQALLNAVLAIVGQRTERKIIFVLTDGQPTRPDHAKAMIQRCRDSGIELIGIGIKYDEVKHYFTSSVVINDVSELKQSLFALAHAVLVA
ncbi:cobaltochelatase CobT-related protein [Piscirickettsia litoralis]|uniref:VWFA domain-containing protein n=1 Tax=Piscirickettsia litoralis TaxID=1891921 RepID=A0ABX2ZXM9_9GAMM|nr:VWA domain-containing protein [Piscirickettsia litoralis]ODN41371.1 hypothetical protein BGC07_16505 [Piscirickettsia litoralis]